MSARHTLLIAAAMLTAPLAAASADVPTKLGESVATENSNRELEAAVRAIREAMFPAGERVENWDVGGADLEGVIRAMGADKYYALETDTSAGSSTLVILSDRPIADFAPAAWRVAAEHGSAETELANPSLGFGYLTSRYVLATRHDGRRVRDADCSDRIGHAILYEVPGAPEAPEDRDIPDLFTGLMLAAEGQTLCVRFDGDREKGYSVRYFFADGRQLLNPDRSIPANRATIVPAAPIDSLIKPPPPAAATPPG
jgi:hypothetical protein